MKKTFFFGLIFWVLIGSSCSSQRELSINKQRAVQVSRELGFTVHPKEELYLYETVASWLGTPYRLGGNGSQGIDCSGFVREIYKNVYNRPLHRTVNSIYQNDIKTISRRKLNTGDLLFFNFTKEKRKFSHVGIYLKKGYFIHASTSGGVIVSHLSTPYYKKGWKKSGKIR